MHCRKRVKTIPFFILMLCKKAGLCYFTNDRNMEHYGFQDGEYSKDIGPASASALEKWDTPSLRHVMAEISRICCTSIFSGAATILNVH